MIESGSEAMAFAQGKSLDALKNDRALQHVLVRDLDIFGEAASRLSEAFRRAHPQLPWANIMGMRNRLVHAYFEIDLGIVLDTVQHDLPRLVPLLQDALDEM